MRPDDVGLGGFDSHTLPPAARARRVARALTLVAGLALGVPHVVRAQQADSAGSALRPPITPKRAFFYSLVIPGLGQSSLHRYKTGAGFFLVEALALALLHRSSEDLRTARAFRGDSVPATYAVDATTGAVKMLNGIPVVDTWKRSAYSDTLITARQLQVEDWRAILIFNHLIAGTDAFVAAQLWDIPARVAIRAMPLRGATGVGLVIQRR